VSLVLVCFVGAAIFVAPRAARAFLARARVDPLGVRGYAEAFGQALLRIDDSGFELLGGESAMRACVEALGGGEGSAGWAIDQLRVADPKVGPALQSLLEDGVPFDLRIAAAAGVVRATGRAAGALALVGLSRESDLATVARRDTGRLADFLNAHPYPAFLTDGEGRPTVVNRAWLEAAGASSLEDAHARGVTFDHGAILLAREALATGAPRESLRWIGTSETRRALRIGAAPLRGGGASVLAWDVTQAASAADVVAKQGAALNLILDRTADAVAVFSHDQRLTYHNNAFARLWDFEPAWLAEGPTHGAVLDRLRQTRRLPEIADFSKFRASELARHERVDPAPEVIWRVSGDRTLRVLSLPHPDGGLIRLFSDITPEVRLQSQWNHLIQVRQATLDKLTDAVAVFGADARLRLHNEAFQRLWSIRSTTLGGEAAFDDIAAACLGKLADATFWNDLKARIADPDPGLRAPVQGEVVLGDGRSLSWQSRPLPDGATLVSFADVTDARRVEAALRDREAALAAAEQLKRDFVASVSYELRTPLTTILGYAELLMSGAEALPAPIRDRLFSVRAASGDLARTVEDILAFAEIDAGELTLNRGRLNVADLASDAKARWDARAESGGVTITVARGGGAARVDKARMARALDHLISHALRTTPAGGEVKLAIRRVASEIRLDVANTGRGVPYDLQSRIFDRFDPDGAPGGAAGLALVKAIVELHGGRIEFESRPGSGALFSCYLPVGEDGIA